MPKVENEVQIKILSSLSFIKDGAKYSQLKVPDIENDLFNYHLQQLVKNGFLLKENNLYKLTLTGKSLVTNIDEIDKKMPPNYKVSVYICIVIEGKVLLQKRLKHPQYGYVGLPSGKIKYGEPILTTASRELNEETGLEASFKIIGNLRQIRKNHQSEIIEDGLFYVCFSDKVIGELNPVTQEGEFFYEKIELVNKIDKLFKPSVEIILDEVCNRIGQKVPWDHQFIYELTPEPEDY